MTSPNPPQIKCEPIITVECDDGKGWWAYRANEIRICGWGDTKQEAIDDLLRIERYVS